MGIYDERIYHTISEELSNELHRTISWATGKKWTEHCLPSTSIDNLFPVVVTNGWLHLYTQTNF